MIPFIYNLDKEISETIFIYKNLGITIFLFFIFYFFVFNYLIFNNYLSFNLINISFNILFIILLGFYIHFCSLKNKSLYYKYKNSCYYLFIYKPQYHLPCLFLIYFNHIFIIIYILLQIGRLYYYYNKTSFRITNIQKCHDKNQNFWTYEIEYDNGFEKKYIQKRFSEFKELSKNLKIKINDNNYLYSNKNDRALQINSYLNSICNHNSVLNNSVFYSFLQNNNNINSSNIILEKTYINNYTNYDYIQKIHTKCQQLITSKIINIVILNEINYHLCSKKRIFILTDNYLYKIKFYTHNNIFEIRNKISFCDIQYIEISYIKNTDFYINKQVLIIYYNNTSIKLISSNISEYYNINTIIDFFKNKSIIIINTDSYHINTGLGISEKIFNNSSYKLIKNTYSDYYKYIFN